MKVLLDTSVLVSVMVESHPHHEWSLHWLKRTLGGEIGAIVRAHSLLELYAVLTRLPLRPPLPAPTVRKLLQSNLCGKVDVRALTPEEYWSFMAELSDSGAVGGQVYDWLIGYAGKLSGAETIVTLNPRHFATMATK